MKISEIKAEQRTPEWYEARKGRVTGSVVGAILGLNPYKTRADVMRDMIDDYQGKPRDFQGNDATAYGTVNEAGAIFDYEMLTGNSVEKAGFFTYQDWLGASPDGLVGTDGLVEIKCPYGLRKVLEPTFKSINDQAYYHAQIQIQLFVSGREWCDFYQWTPVDASLERVTINQAWLDLSIPLLKDFHAEYKEKIKNIIKVDEVDLLALENEYDWIKTESERLESRKKDIINNLVELTNGLGGRVAGRNLTRVEKKGSVSYSMVVKKYLPDIDLEPYRGKSISYWLLK